MTEPVIGFNASPAPASQPGATGLSVRAAAPGKVNVHLAVGPVLPDGYHELATIYQTLDLYETVTLTAAAADSVTVSGRFASDVIPRDSTNLALAAVHALNRRLQVDVPVAVEIDKQVPVAGGMGGGSADAAAALVAHNQLIAALYEQEPAADEVLLEVAASLGADVPCVLHGGTTLGTGRGDELTPVLTRGNLHWVLATSANGLSTPAVYRRLDELRAAGAAPTVVQPAVPAEVLAALAADDPHALAQVIGNDLAAAAVDLAPGIAEVIDTGIQAGALTALVSGSGPTVALLAADARHALDLAVLLAASRGVSEVVRATGPARGAHVL